MQNTGNKYSAEREVLFSLVPETVILIYIHLRHLEAKTNMAISAILHNNLE